MPTLRALRHFALELSRPYYQMSQVKTATGPKIVSSRVQSLQLTYNADNHLMFVDVMVALRVVKELSRLSGSSDVLAEKEVSIIVQILILGPPQLIHIAVLSVYCPFWHCVESTGR